LTISELQYYSTAVNLVCTCGKTGRTLMQKNESDVQEKLTTMPDRNAEMIVLEAFFALSSVSFSIGPNPRALVGHVRTTGRFHTSNNSVNAKIAFAHEIPVRELGCAEGANGCAGVATDTGFPVYCHNPVLRTLADCLGRTDGNAGSFPAMHARQGDILDAYGRVDSGFYLGHMVEYGSFPGISFWSKQATIQAIHLLQRAISNENPI
jgi:hypothetical protein